MTLGPFFTMRGAEKYLGIATYTLPRISKKHPLPKPAIIVDDKYAWTANQLTAWYVSRPQPGGDRKSEAYRQKPRNLSNNL